MFSLYLLTQYLWSIADIYLRTTWVPLLSLFVLLGSQPYESVLESINKRVSIKFINQTVFGPIQMWPSLRN